MGSVSPPSRRSIGWRSAPAAFVLALVNAPVAGWFAIWGLENVNHCNDPPLSPAEDCGLGFAVLIPLGWLATAGMAVGVIGLGFLRLPRWASWSMCALAVAVMWATNFSTLSVYQPRTP